MLCYAVLLHSMIQRIYGSCQLIDRALDTIRQCLAHGALYYGPMSSGNSPEEFFVAYEQLAMPDPIGVHPLPAVTQGCPYDMYCKRMDPTGIQGSTNLSASVDHLSCVVPIGYAGSEIAAFWKFAVLSGD